MFCEIPEIEKHERDATITFYFMYDIVLCFDLNLMDNCPCWGFLVVQFTLSQIPRGPVHFPPTILLDAVV